MKQQLPSDRRDLLRNARLARHWSQKEVANQLQVSLVTVNRWEQGVTTPAPYYCRKLCELFACSAAELGLAPHQETALPDASSSEERWLNDPALPPLQREQLIGREKEIQSLVDSLCSRQAESYALSGLPGVGKTSLAIALAHHPQVRAAFPDGILWVGLGPAPQIIDSLSRWGHVLHLPASEARNLTTPESWVRSLHQLIENRHMLLILDDAWNLADLATFHLGGSQCAHLLTTRFPLLAHTFAHEQVITLRELTQEESLDLLQQLAPQAFQAHAPELSTLAQAVGGLPLALTLLGCYLHVQSLHGSPRRLLAALQNFRENLHARLQTAQPLPSWKYSPGYPAGTPISLQLAIDLSVLQLPSSAQAALHALAVFPSKPYSFSEEAALAVCAVSVETLDLLEDSGLITRCTPERYQIHQTISDYANLQECDPEVEMRYVNYFVQFVVAHDAEDALLEQDLYTLMYVLKRAGQLHLYDLLFRGTLALLPFLERRRLYDLASTVLAQAQQVALARNDALNLAYTWLWQGKMAEMRGEVQQAQRAYVEGLELARPLPNEELLAQLLVRLGGILIDTDSSELAGQYLVEGLRMLEQLNQPPPLSVVFQYLGELADNMGESVKADHFYQRGLQIARKTQNWKVASAILQDLGVKAARRLDYCQAAEHYHEAFTYARQLEDAQRQSALLMNMGMLAWHQLQPDKALQLSLESLRLAREIEHHLRISSVLQNLGIFTRAQGQYEQSSIYLQESLELAQQIGHRWLICETLGECGQLYLKQQKVDQAKTTFLQMQKQAREINAPLLRALALFGLAQVAEAQGQRTQALETARASRALLTDLDNRVYRQEVDDWCASLPT